MTQRVKENLLSAWLWIMIWPLLIFHHQSNLKNCYIYLVSAILREDFVNKSLVNTVKISRIALSSQRAGKKLSILVSMIMSRMTCLIAFPLTISYSPQVQQPIGDETIRVPQMFTALHHQLTHEHNSSWIIQPLPLISRFFPIKPLISRFFHLLILLLIKLDSCSDFWFEFYSRTF